MLPCDGRVNAAFSNTRVSSPSGTARPHGLSLRARALKAQFISGGNRGHGRVTPRNNRDWCDFPDARAFGLDVELACFLAVLAGNAAGRAEEVALSRMSAAAKAPEFCNQFNGLSVDGSKVQ